jgi:5-oxoprolinase (ATP-hydrolysing)
MVSLSEYFMISVPLSPTNSNSNPGPTALFDFSGTGAQVLGNWNAPTAISSAAVMYCLRCLVDMEIPLNSGCMRPIKIKIPKASLLNPDEGLAVCAGNVLTSQRVTDVILMAFNAAAASQGCMNNFTFGNASFG